MIDINLDEVDVQIIELLQRDGRASNRAVGREIGVSESSIRKRLKRLVDLGAISYGVLVDLQAMGFASSAWLGVTAHPASVQSVAELIADMPTCTFCAVATGAVPIRAFIWAKSRKELTQMVGFISDQDDVLDVVIRETISIPLLRHEYVYLSHHSDMENGA